MAALRSYTPGYSLRYPAPDVARGFMLLLVAIANASVWAGAVGPNTFTSGVDEIVVLLRAGFVDNHVYPLFAILFGFGLMTLVRRRRRSYVDAAVQSLHQNTLVSASHGADVSIAEQFDRQSTRAARRLLLVRALFLLVFALIHGLFFSPELTGAFALICLIVGPVIARERFRSLVVVGSVLAVVGSLAEIIASAANMMDYVPVRSAYGLEGAFSGSWFLANLGHWANLTAVFALLSMSLVGIGVGAWLATTDVLASPGRHRVLLEGLAGGGLLLGFLGSLPVGLINAEMMNAKLSAWMLPVAQISGFAGALGWLALLTLFAGSLSMTGELRGLRWILAAGGRRSLSLYLMQSMIFMAVFLDLRSVDANISEVAALLIAVGVWLATMAFAVVCEQMKWLGPMEALMRALVRPFSPVAATSEGRSDLPALGATSFGLGLSNTPIAVGGTGNPLPEESRLGHSGDSVPISSSAVPAVHPSAFPAAVPGIRGQEDAIPMQWPGESSRAPDDGSTPTSRGLPFRLD